MAYYARKKQKEEMKSRIIWTVTVVILIILSVSLIKQYIQNQKIKREFLFKHEIHRIA
jgi:hypothetical protein